MIQSYKVTAFTYLARQDGNQNGMVKAYEVYLSNDGKTWGSPVVTGEFKNTTSLQVATLKTPTKGRYLKFVAKSEINNNAWTSAAEVGIQAEPETTAIQQIDAVQHDVSDGIYDLQGRRVEKGALGNGKLPKGIYIYRGRKYLSNQ